jgi:hypothetical protein
MNISHCVSKLFKLFAEPIRLQGLETPETHPIDDSCQKFSALSSAVTVPSPFKSGFEVSVP